MQFFYNDQNELYWESWQGFLETWLSLLLYPKTICHTALHYLLTETGLKNISFVSACSTMVRLVIWLFDWASHLYATYQKIALV